MFGMMSIAIAFVLIALASGFWVLSTAYKSDGLIKKTGRILGWIIIVFALVSLLDSTISSLGKSFHSVRRRVSAPVISNITQDKKVEIPQPANVPDNKINNIIPKTEKRIK